MDVNYKRKFKLLFDKFFQTDFELSAYYSENMLKYLKYCPDRSAEKVLDTPFFSDLVIYSLSNIENTSDSVKVFIIEVIILLFQNELQFSKMVQLHGFEMIQQKLFNHRTRPPPLPVWRAGIKLVSTLITHYSGYNWGIQSKIWLRVLTPELHTTLAKYEYSNYVYDFISKFVWKLNDYDEELVLLEILQYITDPIKSCEYLEAEMITTAMEVDINNRLRLYLKTLLAILSDTNKILSKNKVIPLLKHCLIEPPLYIMLEITRDQKIAQLISEIIFRFSFAMCKAAVQGNNIPYDITVAYYNIVNVLLYKGMVAVTLDFVVKCNIIWSKVDTRVVPSTFERYGRTFELRNQFMMLIVSPLVTYSHKIHTARNSNGNTEFLDLYYMKLTDITTENIVKAGYSLCRAIDGTDFNKTTIEAIRELFKLKGSLNDLQAGMIYQALYYMLQVHVVSDGMGGLIINETSLKTPDDLKCFSLVFEAIKMLLTEHNINWYESIEIICLQSCLMNLLKQSILPTKQILQALDLIDLSIKKFLSPDLCLLVESKSGSTLNEIGALMVSYIQHEEWEIRDSTLQLLLSCTDVAFVKYIPLQKLIFENSLTVLAAHTALNDTEFYVQNTALKCLATATKIESIWRQVMAAHSDLFVQLVHIMQNNTEGIVRKEALNVLTEVCVNQKVSKSFMSCVYGVMTHAALTDLYWEVQLAALNFWKQTIRLSLANRGMFDGKFPAMTFCKEKRKIITLNSQEIEKQLTGVMAELSHTGCLTVLHKCLNDEVNLEVMEQAYQIIKDFVKILDRYNFQGIIDDNFPTNITLAAVPTDNLADIKPESDFLSDTISDDLTALLYEQHIDRQFFHNKDNRDQVIETIINTNQADLVLELYENNPRLLEEPMDEDKTNSNKDMPPYLTLQPNEFLKSFRETDYLTIIEEKRSWFAGTNNLDTLLDQILTLEEKRRDFNQECNE